ncbi:MAG: glutamine synthetase III [Fusobacteriaceae bacterium]|nr:glutamine synthetase III [Fusobacteriaceae bacterium]MBP6466825.1 glutamine synthetase III [Fusobacteriaceae bacterium]MBP9595153.1 glutamine synthetase III [Fusobacteriaceae bacterium]MBU9918302.1 glutamine synthetase III [Fusobacteriaceae bacterium]
MYSFGDRKLKASIPKTIYKEFKRVQAGEIDLTLNVADVIANAIKDWAIANGATHFTHWFQPLTGLTAEKHDSFINPTSDGGVVIEFSGKELIKGEPDASSFPNGGLRDTYEARGYTAWDTTSPCFLKTDNTGSITLYIPTAFVSYTGEALDKKVPLLRAMKALDTEAMRVLKALGNNSSKTVITTVGAEQEYFLVDKEYYEQRSDLMLAGRTVLGVVPSKGQELSDHYFGKIKERVSAFMKELDFELWKLAVPSKTKHLEVAPNQFEIAVVFSQVNQATDQNQLVMETIERVANRHKLAALLAEKPFAGVNGSGKHNNWSMATDDGMNLLEPGDNPKDNAQFLVFLTAVIEAVDRYQELLRMSAAKAGNDHRLGGHEAPPAIISIFLGDQLSDILDALADGVEGINKPKEFIEIGVDSLPKLPKDMTDRNRTSPFAFTGNKFEFRMVGSSASIAGPNVALNTAVAQVLSEFAKKLESSSDLNKTITEIITKSYKKHKRIVFNGNGYAEAWVKEAKKRGLSDLKDTVSTLPALISDESIELFDKQKVMTKEELQSRFTIYSETYAKEINIEANVMIQMCRSQIFPASNEHALNLAKSINQCKEAIAESEALLLPQKRNLKIILENLKGLKQKELELEKILDDASNIADSYDKAKFYKDKVVSKMKELRIFADELERLVDKKAWPFPTYEDLLFRL